MARYDFLDALRGIAALGVIMTHTGAIGIHPDSEILKSIAVTGSRGVQLFYVISAFSLYLSLHSRLGERHLIKKYFVRRFFRIAPLWWFAIVLYMFIYLVGYNIYFEKIEVWQVVAAFFFLHGMHPCSISQVVPGGWSIAVETGFYMILPLIFIYSGNVFCVFRLFVISIFLENILRRILLYTLPRIFPTIGFESFHHYSDYWLVSQLPIFMAGILSFYFFNFFSSYKLNKGKSHFDKWLLVLCLLMVVAFIDATTFKNIIKNDVLYGVAFAFIVPILTCCQAGWISKVFIFFGTISYSLYLMHGVAIIILKNLIEQDSVINSDFAFIALFFLLVILTTLISVITQKIVETPGMNLGNKVIQVFK